MSHEDQSATESALQISQIYEICGKNSDLLKILVEIDQCKEDKVLKQLIDALVNPFICLSGLLTCTPLIQILRYFSEDPSVVKSELRNVIIEIYLRCNSRKSVRRYLYEVMNTNLDDTSLFYHIIERVVADIFVDINDHRVFRVKQCLQLLNFLFAFMQHFDSHSQFEALIGRLFGFYLCILEIFTIQLL